MHKAKVILDNSNIFTGVFYPWIPLEEKKKKAFQEQDFSARFYYILVQDKVTIQTFDYIGCISLIIKAEITALQTFILMRRLIAEKSRPF